MPGTLSHVEIFWELPVNEYILKQLTSFARVIVFDKHSQDLSDRVAEHSLESELATCERYWMRPVRRARPSLADPKAARWH